MELTVTPTRNQSTYPALGSLVPSTPEEKASGVTQLFIRMIKGVVTLDPRRHSLLQLC